MSSDPGRPKPSRPDRGPTRPDPGGRRGPLAALVLVVVLVGALYAIGQAIVHHNQVQNCLDSGRRDCDTRTANP